MPVLVLLPEIPVKPDEHPVAFVEGMIDPPDRRPIVLQRRLGHEKVVPPVCRARLVGQRIQRQQLLRHRMDAALRKNVARQRLAAEAPARRRGDRKRIVELIGRAQLQQVRKIPVPPRLARHGGNHRAAHVRIAELVRLVSEVPERPVLSVVYARQNHRRAPGDAVPVILVNRQLVARRVGAVLVNRRRVQLGMPQPVPDLPVQLVRAALGAHIHQRPGSAPHAGVERRRLHLELRQRRLRRRKRHARARAVRIQIRHPVDRECVAVVAAAVCGELRRRIVERRLPQPHVGAVHRPRRQMHQVHRIAREKWQLENPPLVHHLPERRLGGLQQRRLRRHLHYLRQFTYRQLNVELHILVHPHLHIAAQELPEPRRFRRNLVHARNQEREHIVAALVRLRPCRDACGRVPRLDLRPGDHRP